LEDRQSEKVDTVGHRETVLHHEGNDATTAQWLKVIGL
jgi:hypothetical protein